MKSEERREQVLATAIDVFAERGYHRTSIADIVSRAGIARGTFYNYFEDKRAIFREMLLRYMAELRSRIVRIDPALGVERGLGMLRQNVRGALETMLRERSMTKILVSDAVGLDDEFDARLLAFYGELIELIERSLMLGREMGIVRECDTHLEAVFMLGALKELMYQITVGGYEPELDALVEHTLRHFLEGLLTLGHVSGAGKS